MTNIAPITGEGNSSALPSLRRDKQRRHDALCALIADEVNSDPYDFEGFLWAGPFSQEHLAARLGLSTRTLRDLLRVPPVVVEVRGMGRDKGTLLRLGVVAPVNHRKTANVLSKHYRTHVEAATTTHRDYGLLFGLVEEWPEGWQVRIFGHVLRNWSAFVGMAKLEIEAAIAYADTDPFTPDLITDDLLDTARRLQGVALSADRRYRYVSLTFLRRFAHIAPKLYLLDLEERGDGKAVALRALL